MQQVHNYLNATEAAEEFLNLLMEILLNKAKIFGANTSQKALEILTMDRYLTLKLEVETQLDQSS